MNFIGSSPSARAILCGIALVLVMGASALGQESDGPRENASNADIENVLGARNRSAMHPGNPLEIVGLEQGANEIRSRTPALQSSDHAVAILNSDEMHERALAMYTSGAQFSQPIKALPSEKAQSEPSLLRRVLKPVNVVEKPLGYGRWLVLLGLLTMLAGIGRLLWSRLKGEPAADEL